MTNRATHTEELRRCPLFTRLGTMELDRLVKASRPLSAPAGQIIFREGQACEGFYVVTEGVVRIYKIAPDGRERTLHIVRPPQAFAEAAMFGGETYPAFAQAIEDSRLILVYRDPFLRLLHDEPAAALRMFESLSRWLHRLLDQLETETFLNARAKLANYLLQEARRQNRDAAGPVQIELRLAKKEIASQLGMAPETFSRAQADLETRGLIRPDGRRIEIPAMDAIERLLLGETDDTARED